MKIIFYLIITVVTAGIYESMAQESDNNELYDQYCSTSQENGIKAGSKKDVSLWLAGGLVGSIIFPYFGVLITALISSNPESNKPVVIPADVVQKCYEKGYSKTLRNRKLSRGLVGGLMGTALIFVYKLL